jgi:Uncharacterized protein conserved in bacteria (DUF2213)
MMEISMDIRSGGGVITSAIRDQAGFLQVHATFLMEGPLIYERDGKKVEELVPWEYISDESCLATATGKPITLGHPNVKDSWMTAKDWSKFGKGMTGNMMFLHRPFAVISCMVGDEKLADDIESGHVQRVSSCRKTSRLMHRETKQVYQGFWEANHLAFIDKRTGRTGRCPGAMLLPKGQLPIIGQDGSIALDSVPGVGYDIPDYSTFERVATSNGLILFNQKETVADEAATAARSRRIILDSTYLIETTEEETTMELTAEQLAAIGEAAGNGMKTSLAGLQEAIVAAITPLKPVADDAPVFTAEQVEAAKTAAATEGRKLGELMSLATLHSADSQLSPDSTITEICKAIILKIDPAIAVDSYDESDLPGLARGLSLQKKVEAIVTPAPGKKGFTGKPVPVADDKDSAEATKAQTAKDWLAKQRKATQVAASRN